MFSAGRINAHGLTTFWQAVNDAVEIWDRDQMKQNKCMNQQLKADIKNPKKTWYRERCSLTQKFKWAPDKTRFRLPKP